MFNKNEQDSSRSPYHKISSSEDHNYRASASQTGVLTTKLTPQDQVSSIISQVCINSLLISLRLHTCLISILQREYIYIKGGMILINDLQKQRCSNLRIILTLLGTVKTLMTSLKFLPYDKAGFVCIVVCTLQWEHSCLRSKLEGKLSVLPPLAEI